MRLVSPAARPGRAYRPAVRVVSVVCALCFMYLYSHSRTLTITADNGVGSMGSVLVPKRQLLSYSENQQFGNNGNGGDSDNDDNDGDDTNCTLPRTHKNYNDSCSFVLELCQDQFQLFNYLEFILCDMSVHIQWLGYIILAVWLVYLISLLATTADYFFVPPLNLLSEKMKLSPSIAGITLLAIGNGAPDVFVAYSGLQQGKIQLVLGALIGASIFISTVVLGTIILIVDVKDKDIDKIDFIRDVTAYILVVCLVVGVAYDGLVELAEAISFLLFYIAYIAIAVIISYLRTHYEKRKRMKREVQEDSETSPLVKTIQRSQESQSNSVRDSIDSALRDEAGSIVEEKRGVELLGLTWPRGSNIATKAQFILEWPFSLIRWISVPPCYYDGQWTKFHFLFAVISPIPVAAVLTIAVAGWSGFYGIYMGKLPIFAFLVLVGLVLSIVLFLLLSWKKPPHWSLQIFLGIASFVMSVAWLNIEANELVAVLNAFGLSFNIDSGIMGLTVVAIGNSVGDWVADTAVARAGKPGMGIASCFGSPLLNDVLGLSIAFITKIGIYDHGKAFHIDVHARTFLKVKMSWIFLGLSLLSSIIIFPLFRFSPPKPFGAALIYFYIVFMIFSVLNETGHLNLDFLK